MSNYATLVDVLIKNEMEGIKNHERVLEMGDTPAILINECGFPELPFAIKASTVSKICFDHGIRTSVIQRLPNIVSSPKGLFRSANPRFTDSVVVLTFEVKSIGPVIVSIRKNVMIGRGKYYNIVTSMYAKEGEDPETKWKSDNLLIWDSQNT
ncbi:TPA: hypothetical protein ACGU7J_004746 [Vibrio vulnificus]